AIASRDGSQEPIVFIHQRDAGTVVFGLYAIGQRVSSGKIFTTLVPVSQVFGIVSVVQTEHGNQMIHVLKLLTQTFGDALCGRLFGDELRIFFFQSYQFFKQLIVLIIRNQIVVVDVVRFIQRFDNGS